MPKILACGRLFSMILVLKEAADTFGLRVQQTLFRPTNNYISDSKSGKFQDLANGLMFTKYST